MVVLKLITKKMSQKILFLIFIFTGLNATAKEKDTVKVGVYINSIYDIKLNEESFSVDFWMWFHCKNDSINSLTAIEFVNAKEFSYMLPFYEKVGNINWSAQKCKAVVKNAYNLENFPFDKQYLKIELEESVFDTTNLVFIADKIGSKYDASLSKSLNGWKISDFSIEAIAHTYNTTYGNPILPGSSSFAEAVVTFVIERESTGLFIKLFTGVYVAFLISLLVFFIKPTDVDPRFGLAVGGIFAAVGNKYIVDSLLPETIKFTLVDIIHNLTFGYILITIIISIISLNLMNRNKPRASKLLDRISFFAVLVSFALINIYFIHRAIQ